MEHFSYKGGHGVRVSRLLKEELAKVIDKRLQVISYILLFKTVIPLRKQRIKPSNIVCIAMWPLVTYSN